MADYWKRRFLKDKAASINRAEDYLKKQQEKVYSHAAEEIRKEIEKIYERFADSENISLAEAKQRIRDADFRRIDWDAMLEESRILRERMKEDVPDDVKENLEKQHKKLDETMRAYAKRGRISYLELRQMEIDKILVNLYDEQQLNIYDYLTNEYDDGYYRSIFNIQQHMGFGYDFTRPNESAVSTAILNRYDKRNFSKSLYGQCSNFSEDLRSSLITGLITGENLDKMAGRIRKRMGVAYSAAKTLVRTETAYIYEKAAMDGYAECGIESYSFLATLDYKTSEICQEMDGKTFKVKDAVPGVNYPPMHPNCRSTTVCSFPEEDAKRKKTTRVARNENGKLYEVPADITYKEWKKEHHVAKNAEKKADKGIQVIRTDAKNIDEKVAGFLQKSYERRRVADGLHASPLDEISEDMRKQMFSVNISGHNIEIQENIAKQMAYLTGKYKTTCYGITTVSTKEAVMNSKNLGWTVFDQTSYMSRIYLPPLKKEALIEKLQRSIKKSHSVAVKEEDYLKYVITHEYGHTILNMKAGAKNWLQMDESIIKKAQKEIRKIYDEYKDTMLSLYTERDNLKERINSTDVETQCKAWKDSGRISKKISDNFISNYAGGYIRVERDGRYFTVERDDLDEFLAESFAMHELGINKSPYAERVAGVLEKYFGW